MKPQHLPWEARYRAAGAKVKEKKMWGFFLVVFVFKWKLMDCRNRMR